MNILIQSWIQCSRDVQKSLRSCVYVFVFVIFKVLTRFINRQTFIYLSLVSPCLLTSVLSDPPWMVRSSAFILVIPSWFRFFSSDQKVGLRVPGVLEAAELNICWDIKEIQETIHEFQEATRSDLCVFTSCFISSSVIWLRLWSDCCVP